jgi:signal transduction histidine kinase
MVIVLSSIILAVYTILSTNKSLTALDSSHDIDKRLQALSSSIKDAEAGQRGYLITSQSIFWETYKEAKTSAEREYDSLIELMKDDEQQERNLITLKARIDERLSLLQENKDYFDRVGKVDDSLAQRITYGRSIMNKMKYQVERIEETEETKLQEVRERTFKSSRLSVYIIILTCGLSLLLLISILIVLNREYQAKASIEKELTESERLLQEQVHKLNLSNKELEQFAYVASHDLQEPLRKIISFSEKIQSKLGEYPDEEVTGSLKRLTTSSGRMRVLINDLLNYSRATRALDVKETVNLDDLFKLIIDDLGVEIANKKAVVTSMNMETVKGNPIQLQQLFQNLISNGLKFNIAAVPTISVWGEHLTNTELMKTDWGKNLALKHDRYYCIFVMDNGIGFDLQYLGQIFVIFQRLHGRSEYEGTGIGLAICKRIAENHEGFITAKSTMGKGAIFIVGLPELNF